MVTQTFTGDGTTTAFTIDSGYTLETLLVTVSGILLQPTSDYTLSGTTLTLSYAPAAGQSVVVREMLGGGTGPTGATGPAGTAGAAGPTGAASTIAGPTGATGPAGAAGTAYVTDTAPVNPTTGQVWMDSTTGEFYIYTGTAWVIATGATGLTGATGPTGSIGPTGPAGASATAAKTLGYSLIFGG
jgi:hypothetical protein